MKRVLFALTLLFTTLTIFADEVSFVASAPNAVVVGQQFRLSYEVNSSRVKEPRVPTIEGFTVLFGPTRSSSTEYYDNNGKVTLVNRTTYTFTLRAEKEGTFTLPAATVEVNGKQVASNPVTVKVLPPDKQTAAREAQGQGAASSTEIAGNELFMTATLNKKKVFEQEAVLLTYKVYSTVNLTSLNGKMPDLKGFHIQEVELPRNKEWQLEHYNGRNYRALTWSQYLLFPQNTGEIEIPSVEFE